MPPKEVAPNPLGAQVETRVVYQGDKCGGAAEGKGWGNPGEIEAEWPHS